MIYCTREEGEMCTRDDQLYTKGFVFIRNEDAVLGKFGSISDFIKCNGYILKNALNYTT